MVKNYMETIIDNLLPEVLHSFDEICKCEKCLQDIKASALNHLQPLYFADEKGSMNAKMNELHMAFRINVMKELIIATNKVSKNPRHDAGYMEY